ncbi:MAG: hypothetical protein AAF442_07730 [Pseudomonadota bacterium]
MISIFLTWCGRHTRVIMPCGVLIALLLPGHGEGSKIFVPLILIVINGLAMARLDFSALLRQAIRPRRLLYTGSSAAVLMVFLPIMVFTLARVLGLPDVLEPILTWYLVAPPIVTAIWICALAGADVAFAVELVVLACALAPFTGPFLADAFLGEALPLSRFDLFSRLFGVIAAGVILALALQRFYSRQALASPALDGLATLAMLAFLVPVFNGIGLVVLAQPMLALGFLGLAMGLNVGSQVFVMTVLGLGRTWVPHRYRQVLAIVTGNRNLGLYFGVLPFDPLLALFTAMYQFPIYVTALLQSVFYSVDRKKNS